MTAFVLPLCDGEELVVPRTERSEDAREGTLERRREALVEGDES
jgi:hypothetical protein